MNINNPYWQPPVEFGKQTFVNTKPNELGFRNDLVYPLPTTIGANYFGEGRQHLDLPKVKATQQTNVKLPVDAKPLLPGWLSLVQRAVSRASKCFNTSARTALYSGVPRGTVFY